MNANNFVLVARTIWHGRVLKLNFPLKRPFFNQFLLKEVCFFLPSTTLPLHLFLISQIMGRAEGHNIVYAQYHLTKHHGLTWNACFVWHNLGWRWSDFSGKKACFSHHKSSWKCPHLIIHSTVTFYKIFIFKHILHVHMKLKWLPSLCLLHSSFLYHSCSKGKPNLRQCLLVALIITRTLFPPSCTKISALHWLFVTLSSKQGPQNT